MRAVACQLGGLEVIELPDPRPGDRQVVVDVTGCGICGSDLHARLHADEQADVLAEAGYDGFMRAHQRVVLGHELCGEVADYGPDTLAALPVGTPVVAMPLIRHGAELHAVGLSASAPGAYAEQVVVQEALMFAVPNGLAAEVAVLTEPMAVAWHAVARSAIADGDVAVVIGCGPVGLAVICMLKARGVETIVASDLSPGRRSLAAACGAGVVVDPAQGSPFAVEYGWVRGMGEGPAFSIATLEQLARSPGAEPWHVVWRAAEQAGQRAARPVVFECVGVPGMIDQVITTAPLLSRVVVAGVCAKPDVIRPVMAVNKQIDLRFVVGYSPLEFYDTLALLADGTVDVSPIVTGTVGLDGVEAAFDSLGDPERHAKIVIDPRTSIHTV